MRSRIITNSFRTIKKNFPRFLSLLIMSMLGVFVFSGLQATSPDMIKTLDNYLDEGNVYDIKIISTMGLTKEDISYLNGISDIKEVEGISSKDVLVRGEEEYVVNVSSIPNDINKLELVEGRLPINSNEMVVEPNLLTRNNLSIGDKLILADEVFINKEVTIVGTVTSPIYFNSVDVNQNRGTTSIGTGTIHYYTFVLPSNFDQDYYSAIYVTVEGSKEKITSSSKYEKVVGEVYEYLDSIKADREEARYQEIYNKAKDKVIEEEKKANAELEKVKNELDNAKKELDEGKKKLDTSKKQLDNYKKVLSTAKKELDSNRKAYQTILKEKRIEEKNIPSMRKELETSIIEIENTLKELETPNITEEEIDKTLVEQLEVQLQELKVQLGFLKQLQESKNQLSKASKEYNQNYSYYQSQLNIYNKGMTEYNKNKQKYEESYFSYLENKEIVEQEIKEAYAKLEEIKHPIWYLYDRNDLGIYSDYIEDSNSIRNLSLLFPVIFYAVAVLVSLISMNRMVEDDRLEIGTLKSLGFSNKSIMQKYLLFSSLATILGGIIGSILGLIIIPTMIFSIYGILFSIPNFYLGLNLGTTLLGFILSILCICGATIITVRKVLLENSASLMRAKAPKKGKRVLLEKIGLLWNHLSFSNKVTVRNLFRYKKRVLVTIFGIAGCTALMLCGFGIKDSIVDIASMQYENTYHFDAMVYVNDLEDKNIFDKNEILNLSGAQVINAEMKDIDVNLFIIKDDTTLKDITTLVNKEGEELSLEKNKVIITDKLADLASIKVGDTITFMDVDHHIYTYEVSAITKNYIGHYIYMDIDTYEKNDLEYKENVLYMNIENLNQKDKDTLTTTLLEEASILQVVYIETLVESVTNMLSSLDKVVAILIVLAAMLSFVVLYNLSNINIHERKREIATLKVLGFYHQEVDSYITKENIILTIIGISIGLLFGTLLTNAVITMVEIERARFIHHISFHSYFYASMLSILFTIIVNIITHFSLKKIDMIESLKSVE